MAAAGQHHLAHARGQDAIGQRPVADQAVELRPGDRQRNLETGEVPDGVRPHQPVRLGVALRPAVAADQCDRVRERHALGIVDVGREGAVAKAGDPQRQRHQRADRPGERRRPGCGWGPAARARTPPGRGRRRSPPRPVCRTRSTPRSRARCPRLRASTPGPGSRRTRAQPLRGSWTWAPRPRAATATRRSPACRPRSRRGRPRAGRSTGFHCSRVPPSECSRSSGSPGPGRRTKLRSGAATGDGGGRTRPRARTRARRSRRRRCGHTPCVRGSCRARCSS